MKDKKTIFWGCTFTHNYPFLKRTTEKVLRELNQEIVDPGTFSCCPDPVYMKAYNQDTHLSLSARNLAIAEEETDEMLVVCNGCYNVLHEANSELIHEEKRQKINENLQDRQYQGEVEVKHLLSLLNDNLAVLKTKIRRPLEGLKVAVHYGCHILYPCAVEEDEPENPTSMDKIVETLGAESIQYESKLDCCGTPVAAFDQKEADRILEKKLDDIQEVDCIVTTCPACFMRFDMPPREMKDKKKPVLHLSELIALALGYSAEELFLKGHMTSTDEILEKLGPVDRTEEEIIRQELNLLELENHCEACRDECTAAEYTRDEEDFDPLHTVDLLLEGKLNEVLQSDDLWRCLQCGKCEERCPNNIGLKEMFAKLRQMSLQGNKKPWTIENKIELIQKTGQGMPRRKGVRKRMGIEDAPKLPEEEIQNIREILEKTDKEEENV